MVIKKSVAHIQVFYLLSFHLYNCDIACVCQSDWQVHFFTLSTSLAMQIYRQKMRAHRKKLLNHGLYSRTYTNGVLLKWEKTDGLNTADQGRGRPVRPPLFFFFFTFLKHSFNWFTSDNGCHRMCRWWRMITGTFQLLTWPLVPLTYGDPHTKKMNTEENEDHVQINA